MSDINQQGAAQEKVRQIQCSFGAAAADYVTSKVHASGQDLEWVVEAAALKGTEQVLDVATGAGHTAFALAPYAAEVVALDITREMLAAAEQVAAERHLYNIRFLEGDARALPCPDAAFDVVACRQAAHHFLDIRQCVHEWTRVLKPGGKLVLVDSVSPEEPDIDGFLEEIEVLRDPSHVRSHRLSAWLTLLNESGFSVKSSREFGIYLDVPSWTQRMRTPAASVKKIEELLATASPATRERLRIEKKEGAFGFTLPTGLILAVRNDF